MKIAFTVTELLHAVNGGEAERKTCVVDIGEALPPLVLRYLAAKKEERPDDGKWCYQSMSVSIVEQ